MKWPVALAIDCAVWTAWGLATGWALHRTGTSRLDRESWITRPRTWERGGRMYRRVFRVQRWQSRLPEARLFGGADKRRIGGRSSHVLLAYVRETRRAEYVHWLGIMATPVFTLWNPPGLVVAMAIYAVAANGPCLVSLRANRLRVLGVLARRR